MLKTVVCGNRKSEIDMELFGHHLSVVYQHYFFNFLRIATMVFSVFDNIFCSCSSTSSGLARRIALRNGADAIRTRSPGPMPRNSRASFGITSWLFSLRRAIPNSLDWFIIFILVIILTQVIIDCKIVFRKRQK